ncbi:class I SAM-dependent RNA methyltransferase [Phytoactinopolyspora alkaliphila]|uniref:class I SAM-dependent RNA methyltransferase n=1 Tax=Phytoactinopolyspora alkaliphila TaxID=1783498 RepID=UPI001C204D39
MPAPVEITVEIDRAAHGGFGVGRHEGRVVFVRHSLPGERVRALVTDGADDARYWRADAVEVLSASPDRVTAPCRYARPGQCGGCDWQHASLPAQRRLKAGVVQEQLSRLAGIEWDVVVEPVPRHDDDQDDDGLGWRTRVTYAVDDEDRAGLRRHRSHEVIPIEECLIAHPGVRSMGVEGRRWPGVESVESVTSSSGERLVVVEPGQLDVEVPDLPEDVSVLVGQDRGRPRVLHGQSAVTELAGGRRWRVTGGGFWQVHPGAATTLTEAVLEALAPQPGERALDLYSGVGLFAAAIADRVGRGGRVTAIEGDRSAVADARHNLSDMPQVRIVSGPVAKILARDDDARADVVVLDPPRAGAKLAVVSAIARRRPRAIAYVACDPAALARDLAALSTHGYELAGLRAFDLFPMTHHVECVALVRPRA